MVYLIKYFIQFKKFIGRRVYYLLTLAFIVGFVEGLGVTLFLPILQNGFGDDKISKVIKSVFDFFHIGFSFTIILVVILGVFILRSVFLIFYARYFGKVSSNLVVALRRKVLDKIFAADYVYLLKKEVGYINNAMVREIAYVVDAFYNLSSVLKYMLYGLTYTALSLLLNFKLTLCIIALGTILLFFMKKLNLLTNQVSFALTSSYGRLNSIIIQALSKIKYLKATATHPKISEIIDKENKKLGHLQFKMSFLQSLSKDAFEPFIVLVVVGILFYYVVLLKKSVSEVIFLVFLFLQIARQFMNTQTAYRSFLAARGSIETFNGILKELDENKENLMPDGIAPDFHDNIVFKDVTLIFPNGKKALDGLNITIKPRTVVAFVGHSGSGKSTIANMITGIIKPTSGEVRFGGTPYEKINLEALRRHTGYVTQEDIIFNANIKNNISLWDENPDEGRLRKAAGIAHMADFLKGLPDGYDAMLGDNGLDISGGQRQRVTIARELYKDTRLLILDEATSALDAKYEKALYENLKEYKGRKTMVVIAHRLSTIKNADYIYVMDEGRIVEEGTFEGLSTNKDTKFYQICQLQSV